MPDNRVSSVINLSYYLRDLTDWIGRWAALLFLPIIFITVWDVFARKAIWVQQFMMRNFGEAFSSTILQELEWHFHTALFALVFGYGFIRNSHVRVDLVRGRLGPQAQAWIEFLGTSLFAIPFTIVISYFAWEFLYMSYVNNEISMSLTGLTHRWIIKSIFGAGLLLSLLACLAVWLQTVLVLFAPKDIRFELMTLEWPEDMGGGVEGYQRLVLEETENKPSSK